MKRRFWSRSEIKFVRAAYPHQPTNEIAEKLGRSLPSVYQVAANLGLKKSEAYLNSPSANRLRRGDNVGMAFRFLPGHVPANKGVRRPGWGPGRMKETQFKKGNRTGRANHVYQPIGAERVSKDGYRERKINDGMPFKKRWRFVHLLMWEAVNGPLPRGHAVVFKNGKKDDIRLENLQLISRAELMRRNSIHNYPPEIKQTVRAFASLTRALHTKEKSDAK